MRNCISGYFSLRLYDNDDVSVLEKNHDNNHFAFTMGVCYNNNTIISVSVFYIYLTVIQYILCSTPYRPSNSTILLSISYCAGVHFFFISNDVTEQ